MWRSSCLRARGLLERGCKQSLSSKSLLVAVRLHSSGCCGQRNKSQLLLLLRTSQSDSVTGLSGYHIVWPRWSSSSSGQDQIQVRQGEEKESLDKGLPQIRQNLTATPVHPAGTRGSSQSATKGDNAGGDSPLEKNEEVEGIVQEYPHVQEQGPISNDKTTTRDNGRPSTIPRRQDIYYFKSDIFRKIKKKQSEAFFSYTENNYMDTVAAKDEYLLEDSDIASIHKFKKVNPFSSSKQAGSSEYIELGLTSDFKKKAIEKWSSLEGLEREKTRRKLAAQTIPPGVRIRQFATNFKTAFMYDSGQVVIVALLMNTCNAVFKGLVWYITRSPSMFAEFMHSCVDTLNQVFLCIGRFLSLKAADHEHPYGYRNHVHIWSIFSGIIIFGAGFAATMTVGINGLFHPQLIDATSLYNSIMVLCGSFFSESVSLIMAINQIKLDAKKQGMSFYQYVMNGEDPLVNVVLLEDTASVLGVITCGAAMTLSHIHGLPYLDPVGSIIISSMLGMVAAFLYKTNSEYLLGKRLPYENEIKRSLEADRFINAVFDNKTIDSGDQSRFKAEVAYDAQVIVENLLDTDIDSDAMFVKWQSVKTSHDMEQFLEEFGVQVYDEIVKHIDRTEQQVKKKFPEIRHIDIEPK